MIPEDLHWLLPSKCDAGKCPKIALQDGMVYISTTGRPDKVAILTESEYATLLQGQFG